MRESELSQATGTSLASPFRYLPSSLVPLLPSPHLPISPYLRTSVLPRTTCYILFKTLTFSSFFVLLCRGTWSGTPRALRTAGATPSPTRTTAARPAIVSSSLSFLFPPDSPLYPSLFSCYWFVPLPLRPPLFLFLFPFLFFLTPLATPANATSSSGCVRIHLYDYLNIFF